MYATSFISAISIIIYITHDSSDTFILVSLIIFSASSFIAGPPSDADREHTDVLREHTNHVHYHMKAIFFLVALFSVAAAFFAQPHKASVGVQPEGTLSPLKMVNFLSNIIFPIFLMAIFYRRLNYHHCHMHILHWNHLLESKP